MRKYRSFLVGMGLATILAAVGAFVTDYFLVRQKVRRAPPSVQVIALPVLRAEIVSPILGQFWEDSFLEQVPSLKTMSSSERVEFFTLVLMYCDLSNYRAVYFIEAAESDGEEVLENLLKISGSPNFENYPDDVKSRIRHWIDTFPTVIRERN